MLQGTLLLLSLHRVFPDTPAGIAPHSPSGPPNNAHTHKQTHRHTYTHTRLTCEDSLTSHIPQPEVNKTHKQKYTEAGRGAGGGAGWGGRWGSASAPGPSGPLGAHRDRRITVGLSVTAHVWWNRIEHELSAGTELIWSLDWGLCRPCWILLDHVHPKLLLRSDGRHWARSDRPACSCDIISWTAGCSWTSLHALSWGCSLFLHSYVSVYSNILVSIRRLLSELYFTMK